MHRVSLPLLEEYTPTRPYPSGDKLGGSNRELHYKNSLATGLNLVRHAGMRACLYFPPENGAPERNGGKLWHVSITDGIGNGMRRIHLFQKKKKKLASNWIKVSLVGTGRVSPSGCSRLLSHGITTKNPCTLYKCLFHKKLQCSG